MTHGSNGGTETITHTHGSGEDDNLEINGEDDRCNGSFELIIADNGKFDDIAMQASTPTYCINITCSSSQLCANAGDTCSCPGAGSDPDTGADCTSPGFCVGSDGTSDCGSGSLTSSNITLAGSAEYQLFATHP
jgi:hypothetical protein